MIRTSSSTSAAWFVMSLAFFSALCLSRFHHIHGELEITGQMTLIRELFQDWYTHGEALPATVPHLYALVQWGMGELFGQVNSFTLRLTNLLGWLGALGASAWICRRHHWRWLLVLCVTSPLFIAAVTLVDAGCGLLPLLLVLLVHSAEGWLASSGRWRQSLSLAGCLALCSWCDLRTVLLLCPICLGWAWRCQGWPGFIRMIATTVLGLGLFVVSWGVYGSLSGVHWLQVFDAFPWQSCLLGVGVAVAGCWYQRGHGDVSCCGVSAGLWLLLAEALQPSSGLAWIAYSLVTAVGLWLSCARWMCPSTCVNTTWPLLILCMLSCLAWSVAVGDPLLTFRLGLGESYVFDQPVLWQATVVIGTIVCFMLLAALSIWWFRGRGCPVVPGLIGMLAGVQIGLLAQQGLGDYQCGTVYGDCRDIRLTAAWMREHGHAAETSLVPVEVLEALGQANLAETPAIRLEDMAGIRNTLVKMQPSFLAVSWLTHSPVAIRGFLHDATVREFLKHYEHRQSGHVLMWWKRERNETGENRP